eukprot:6212625-Pleurochrysis_carterae.AAC.2
MHPKTVCQRWGQRLQSLSSFRQKDQSECMQWIAWRIFGSAPEVLPVQSSLRGWERPAKAAGGRSHGRWAARVRAARSAAWVSDCVSDRDE